jgi:hypothetical protein
MRWPRHYVWYVSGACVAAFVVFAAVVYVAPRASAPPPVTIESIDWQLQQNAPENGLPEFDVAWINQSGSVWGFPFQVRAGGTFNDSLVILVGVPSDVPICTATVSSPLVVVATSPALPMRAAAEEDNLLVLTLSVEAGAGVHLNATGTITGYGCSLPPQGAT